MRPLIKISITVLLVITTVLFAIPKKNLPSFYDVTYMEICALLGAFLIYIVPKIIKNTPEKKQVIFLLQTLILVAIGSNILGDLGLYQLYKVGFPFDKLIHFFTPFWATITLPIVLNILSDIPWKKALIRSGIFILFSEIIWEISEYLADIFFKTHIFGVYGNNLSSDTKFDLIFGVLGIFSGLFLHYYFPKIKEKLLTI